MKLYATVTSERASKGQGGNKYLDIALTVGNAKEQVNAGSIHINEMNPDIFTIHYKDAFGKVRKINEINTRGSVFEGKGEKQKGEHELKHVGKLHDEDCAKCRADNS